MKIYNVLPSSLQRMFATAAERQEGKGREKKREQRDQITSGKEIDLPRYR